LLVLDPDLRVTSANPAFYSTFQVRSDQTLQRLVYDLGNGQWNIPALRDLLKGILERGESFSNRCSLRASFGLVVAMIPQAAKATQPLCGYRDSDG
jgi:hypothetical protein